MYGNKAHDYQIEDLQSVKIIEDPNKLIEKMGVIVGEIQSGNTNDNLKNELSDIVDILHNKNIISSDQHKQIFEKYIL